MGGDKKLGALKTCRCFICSLVIVGEVEGVKHGFWGSLSRIGNI